MHFSAHRAHAGVMATELVSLSNELAAASALAAASIVAVHGRRGIGSSGIAWRDNLIVTSSEGIRVEEGIKLLLPDGRIVELTMTTCCLPLRVW